MPRQASQILTSRTVAGLTPATTRFKVSDLQVQGLAVEVATTGRKTWVVHLRKNGRRTTRVLGRFPQTSLADARAEARRLLAQLDEHGFRRVVRQRTTFEELADDFIELYAKRKKRTWQQDQDHLRRDLLPRLAKRPIADIGPRDIQELLAEIADRAPTTANNVHSLLSKMFRWARQREMITHSPMSDGAVPKPAPKRAGQRVLTDIEVAKLWRVWAEEGSFISAAAMLWTLTGQRRSEILGLRWEEVHLGLEPYVEIPEDRMKSKRPHRLALPAAAAAILEALHEHTGESPWVFPGHGTDGPISSTNTAMRRWKSKSEVEGWDQRAIRRSVATWLAELGTPHHVIDVILAHVPASRDTTRANYIRYPYLAESRAALDDLAEWLSEVTDSDLRWTRNPRFRRRGCIHDPEERTAVARQGAERRWESEAGGRSHR